MKTELEKALKKDALCGAVFFCPQHEYWKKEDCYSCRFAQKAKRQRLKEVIEK